MATATATLSPVTPPPLHAQSSAIPTPPLSPVPKKGRRRKVTPASSTGGQTPTKSRTLKPKQTKSRNGCATCKLKRLKCDETKPGCHQCARRNVECGGYRRDFKWRKFEETTYGTKPLEQDDDDTPICPQGDLPWRSRRQLSGASTSSLPSKAATALPELDSTRAPDIVPSSAPCITLPFVTASTDFSLDFFDFGLNVIEGHPFYEGTAEAASSITPPEDGVVFSGAALDPTSMESCDLNTLPSPEEAPLDIENEEDDLAFEDLRRPGGVLSKRSSALEPTELLEHASSKKSRRTSTSSAPYSFTLYQPSPAANSLEVLLGKFDKHTCSILSLRDGPNENPWRTIMWPLAVDSPALLHAIGSMTAFHLAKRSPQLKVQGMEHMRTSITHMVSGLERMPVETALATALVLAFAESWDIHISTGAQHLRGARVWVEHVRSIRARQDPAAPDAHRLKFLCNSWTYMDVIARLTSDAAAGSDDLDQALLPTGPPHPTGEEVDPLMGCASTLFPLIGQVADLVAQAKRARSSSIPLIARASALKAALEAWRSPPALRRRGAADPDGAVRQHSLRTAEAYQWATLLHLHQAFPEVPARRAAWYARRVLVLLATIPPGSRTVIIHIFPLLAAGCEAEAAEDRAWVDRRWEAMAQRMQIGNVDRCQEVTREVWARRDRKAAPAPPRDPVDFFTVLGAGTTPLSPDAEPEAPGLSSGDLFSGLDDDPCGFLWAPSHGGLLDTTDTTLSASNGSITSSAFGQQDRESRFDPFADCNIVGDDATVFEPSHRPQPDFLDVDDDGQELEPRSAIAKPPPGEQREAVEDLPLEQTVRGRAHWVGVMRDWKWEVFLG